MAVVLETNFVRLLTCTEALVSDGKSEHWHYPVFLKKLECLLKTITSSTPRPTAEFLHIYEKRLKQLKTLQDMTVHPTQNPFITPLLQNETALKSLTGQSHTSAFCSFFDPTVSSSTTTPPPIVDNGISSSTPSPTLKPISIHRFFSDVPDLLQREQNKQNQELRRRLLGSPEEQQRGGKPSEKKSDDYGELLNSQAVDREKIAEYMLSLTKDLRLTSLAIGERIRSDITVLEESNTIAQAHAASLSDISRSLREELGRSFGLVVWCLFLVSIGVFFWMVIFMKFAPKVT